MPKETISTNINPNGAKGGTKVPQQKPGRQASIVQEENDDPQDDEVKDNQCQFCHREDEDFNPESLDIHYWKECPMLTTCQECEQVIEIAGL